MPSKTLRAGGEVDSYCTKCRLVLNHRIIAMIGNTPRKVECSTCNSHHLYRARPPGEKAEPGVKVARGAGSKEPEDNRACYCGLRERLQPSQHAPMLTAQKGDRVLKSR